MADTPPPTPEDAPEGFWEDFGKWVAEKSGLLEKFVKEGKEAPAPEPTNDPPAPSGGNRKSWF